jgi:erythromycin esterase-like protein
VESTPSLNDAVDKVLASLGDSVELLGFGEALHGGEDILRLRNRFFKRLVEAHGYTAIAIETGYDEAYAVNEYVAGHGPATYETLLDSGYGRAFGRLEANRDLVDWMRQYNSDESRPLKLQFYGFDISIGATRIAGPHRVLRLALDYLSAIDSASGQEHRQQIDSLLAEASGWDEAWTDPTKAPALKPVGTALRVATEDLITELRVRRPELVAKSNEGRYLDALQYALVARQMLNFHAAVARTTGEPPAGTGLRGVRDALMADNLAYIVAREQGRGKVMVFAHNEHLQRGKSVWPCCGQKFKGTDVYAWWPAGSQLNDMFGRRYAVIGSALGVSDDVNGLGQPEAGSLEARLTVVPGLALFIPTHRGQGLPAAEIATLKPRSGSSKNLSYTALDSQSLTNFDWLQVLGSTGYALQLPGGTIR